MTLCTKEVLTIKALLSLNLFTAICNVRYNFQAIQKFSKTADCNAKFCLLDIRNQVNSFSIYCRRIFIRDILVC